MRNRDAGALCRGLCGLGLVAVAPSLVVGEPGASAGVELAERAGGIAGTNGVGGASARVPDRTPSWMQDMGTLIRDESGHVVGVDFSRMDGFGLPVHRERWFGDITVQDCQPFALIGFLWAGSGEYTDHTTSIRVAENFVPGFQESSPGAGDGTPLGTPLQVVQTEARFLFYGFVDDIPYTPQDEYAAEEWLDDDPAVTGLPVLDVTTTNATSLDSSYGVPDGVVDYDDYRFPGGIQHTPGFDESFIQNIRWTIRYYVDSGDRNPDLPIANAALGPGDSSADLVAKFQYVGEQFEATTGEGIEPDAGEAVFDFLPYGFICDFGFCPPINDVTCLLEHDPVVLQSGACCWVEITPDFTPGYPAQGGWLSGLGGDGFVWDDSNGNGFNNPADAQGEEVERDLAFCIDADTLGGDPGASGTANEGIDLALVQDCTNNPCVINPQPNDDCLDAYPLTLGVEAPAPFNNTDCAEMVLEGEAQVFTSVADGGDVPEGGSYQDLPQGNRALWFSIASPTGLDLTASLCSPTTQPTTDNGRRNWAVGAYCGACDKLYPVAWDIASNRTNAGCALPFSEDPGDPSASWTFPEITWPTTAGEQYLVLVYSNLRDGDVGLTVWEEAAATGAPEDQCSPCALDLAGFVPDLIENEDTNGTFIGPSGEPAGTCYDINSGHIFYYWNDYTRTNDACTVTNTFSTPETNAYHQRYTNLDPLDQYSNAQIFGTTGPGGGLDPETPLPPPSIMSPGDVVHVQGTVHAQPVPYDIDDFDDQDNYAFRVATPTMVRLEARGDVDLEAYLGSYQYKSNDPNLGPLCGTLDALTDGLRNGRCDGFVSQMAVVPANVHAFARIFNISFAQASYCGENGTYLATITFQDCSEPSLEYYMVPESETTCDPGDTDTNAGCDFDESKGETEAYDDLLLGSVYFGELGTNPYLDPATDWVRFTAPTSGAIDLVFEAAQDLFVQVYSYPIPDCDLASDNFVGSATVATRDLGGTCATEAVSIDGLDPGAQFAIQIGPGHDGVDAFEVDGRPCGSGFNAYTLRVDGGEYGACLGGDQPGAPPGQHLFDACRLTNKLDCDLAGGVYQGSNIGCPVDSCITDQTTNNTNPGDPAHGLPDGAINGADISFFVELWLGGHPRADLTTTNTNPGDPGFGSKDGSVNGADLSFYVELWLATSTGGACEL